MKKLIQLVFVCSIFGFSACAGDPNPLPTGYTYHDQPYKSVPGDRPKDIGYDFSDQENQDVISAWRDVSLAMIEELEAKDLIRKNQLIYLKPTRTANAQQNNFHFVLYDILREKDYLFTDNPDAGTNINPSIELVKVKELRERNQLERTGGYDRFQLGQEIGTIKQEETLLTLAVSKINAKPERITRQFVLPSYGAYERIEVINFEEYKPRMPGGF